MKINKLLTVKKYEAGRDGNLLVAIDDDLVAKAYMIDDKVIGVKPLICTAYVKDAAAQNMLKKHTDGRTPVDRVIVVNKRFQALFNKTQLILLERQNAMEDVTDPDSDVETRVYGDVAAMAKYGVFRTKMAIHKADRFIEKTECKAGSKLHKDEMKRVKEQWKNSKKKEKLGDILEDDDEWDDEWDDYVFEDQELETAKAEEAPKVNPEPAV